MKFKFEDIQDAFEFVNSEPYGEHNALLDKSTGKMYWHSDVADLEPIPEEIWDSPDVVAVPHGKDLDLGSKLVFDFVEIKSPADYDLVRAFFSRAGAYARFKDFLHSKGLLEAWYDFYAEARDRALREWCEESGIEIED